MAIGIAGARGFIGSHLSRHVVRACRSSVRLLVRNTSNYESPPSVEVLQGDLMSRLDCERFARDLDVIYYLAHTNTPVNSDFDLPSDALVNLVPLLNLLESIRKLGTRPHIIYFSSGGAVYAPKQDRVPYKEADPCGPTSSYGIQKLAAEEYLRLAAAKGFLTATILRVGNVYGIPLSRFRTQGLIGVAVTCVAQGLPVRVFGNPRNVRDYIHMDDLSEIALCASAPRQPFTIVNVSSGTGHSVLDILRTIEEIWGHHFDTHVDQDYGTGLIDWVVLDNGKARHDYGWSPTVDIRSGINRMLSGLMGTQSRSRLPKFRIDGVAYSAEGDDGT
jgi:UDP-glucose 4-epimerase